MNKSECVLAIILSCVFVLWGLFGVLIFGVLVVRELRFTVLYFGLLVSLLSISIVERANKP